jgi:hypothetical protein
VAQDIIRKIMGDELPDFYNIVLERPRDDPTGYDVMFIDAAAKVLDAGDAQDAGGLHRDGTSAVWGAHANVLCEALGDVPTCRAPLQAE